MEYRNLGRTGCKVSPICLGAMMFGAKTELDESMAMIDRAIDSGINFIDTANVLYPRQERRFCRPGSRPQRQTRSDRSCDQSARQDG